MSGLFDQITNYSPPLLTAGQVNYKGTWDASANSPALTSPPAATTKGDYYVVSVAGTQFSISFAVGDWIISNGTAWEKVDLTDAVSSVFGRTGAVVGASTDYSSVGLTNTAIGASSPSTGAFTTVTASSTIAATGAVTGSNLSGTNTGDQTISITGDATASGSTGVLTATVSKINGTALSGLATGILKNTTTTGVPSIAVAADFPTLNQNTTGSAATLTTTRAIYGNNFDGSAALTQVIASTYGGTGNGFAKFSGPASSEKTFTLPNASSTLLYDGGALGTPASGTVTNLTGTASININGTVGATTPSTIAATSGTFSGSVTLANGQAIRGTTTSATTGQILTLSGDNNIYIGAVDVGGNVIVRANAGSTVGTFTSTGLNSTAIGATTASTGAFTTLSSTGGLTLNDGTANSPDLRFQTTSGTRIMDMDVSTVRILNMAATNARLQLTDAGNLTVDGSVTGQAGNFTALSGTTGNLSDVLSLSGFATPPASGASLEIGYQSSGSNGLVQAYDRTASAYRALNISGSTVNIQSSGSTVGAFSSTGLAVTGALSSTTGANFATSSGSVGIGTASPAYKLDITDNSTGVQQRLISSSTSGTSLALNNTATNGRIYRIGSNFVTGTGEFALYDDTAAAARITVSSTGNVGIGTSSPAVKLEVSSATTAEISAVSSGYTIFGGSLGLMLTQNSSGLGIIKNSGVSAIAISTTGNVGFNRTNPICPIDGKVASSATNQLAFQVSNDVDSNLEVWIKNNVTTINAGGTGNLVFATGSSVTERARIDSSGNFMVAVTASAASPANGICTANPTGGTSLNIGHANGTTSGFSYMQYAYNGSNIGYIYQDGTTAVVYSTTSDYRRKSNVKDLSGSGTFIDALKPRTFDWDTGDKGVGFIAHEFAEVSPSSVRGQKDEVDSDGKPVYQAMQASSAEVIANLVAELQSLRQRVAALESSN